MKRRQIIIVSLLLFLPIIAGAKNWNYRNDSMNTSYNRSTAVISGDWDYLTSFTSYSYFENVYKTEDGSYSTISFTMCDPETNADLQAKNGFGCDYVDEEFIRPILYKNGKGEENAAYQPKMESLLKQTIIDNELNSDSLFAHVLAEQICGDFYENKSIPAECSKKAAKIVLDNLLKKADGAEYDENIDLVDANIYQVLRARNVLTNEYVFFNTADRTLCTGVKNGTLSYYGVNGVIRTLCGACVNKKPAYYGSSMSGYEKIPAWSEGICIWDSTVDPDAGNCRDDCKTTCARRYDEKDEIITCFKSCITKNAGVDETCPNCVSICAQKCNTMEGSCFTSCISERAGTDPTCPPVTSNGGSPDPDPDPDPNSDPDVCVYEYTFVPNCEVNPSLCVKNPQTLPDDDIIPGSCGENYSSDTYKVKESLCDGLVNIIEHTHTEISFPQELTRKTIFAGKGFNWYDQFTGYATVTTYAGSKQNITAELQIKIDAKNELVAKRNAEAKYQACLARVEAKKAVAECSAEAAKEYNKCMKNSQGNEQACSSVLPATVCYEAIEKIATAPKEAIDKVNEQYEVQINAAQDNIQVLNQCLLQANNYKRTTKVENNIASTTSSKIIIGDYTQMANSIKAIEKNSGNLLESLVPNSIINPYNFVIPNYIPNKTTGMAVATGYSKYAQNLEVECPFKVNNTITCDDDSCIPDDDDEDDDSQIASNIIYRPISLTNPFPDKNSNNYRETLGLWNKKSAELFITKNREVNDYEVYNLTPMYSITLTPSDIKSIREYNKKNSYSDFNLECENGLYCRSNFLRNSNFSHIVNIDNSCAMGNDWYACDSTLLGDARNNLLPME